jgi:lipopolysaccharide/colanic/teichoic acid biosynthesis glycosyltransferase
VSRYTADQLRILAIKPGITGPSQVMFRHEETLLQNCDDLEAVYLTRILPEKLAIDLTYVDKNHSLLKELWLIMLTLLCLFKPAKQDDCDAPSGRKEHHAGEMPASSRVPRC